MNVLKAAAALAFFVCFTFNGFGQSIDEQRCSTTEYMQMQLQRNPSLALEMKSQENVLKEWIAGNKHKQTRGVITIPVVVHLVYNPAVNMNLSDWQVKSQIDVLNEDFRRLNADEYKTPSAFNAAAADCEIQFCLARRDPNGNATTGILREPYFNVTSFDMGSFETYKTTHWPREQYLNIWVAKLTNSVLGFTTFPSVTDFTDGVVVTDTAFGRIGELKGKYNRGRTATHEVGHWLNLIHVWGDDGGNCSGTDECDDTPNQADSNIGCPIHPSISCSNNGDMFMNYMDYVHDSCMNIFSNGQKQRMIGTINTARATILSSPACNSPVTYDYDLEVTSIINPVIDVHLRYINPLLRVTNVGSQTITGFNLYYQFYDQDLNTYTWNGTLASGATEVITLPQIRDSLGYDFFIAYAKQVLNSSNALVDEIDTVNNYATRSYYVDNDANNVPNNMTAQYDLGNSSIDLVFDQLVYNSFDVSVFNVLGQYVPITIRDKSFNVLNIDLLNAVPGVYFVRAINAGEKLTTSILKLPAQ